MKKFRRLTKTVLYLLTALLVICGACAALAEETNPLLQQQYDAAQALFDAQDYEKAMEAFSALGDYEDSADRAEECAVKWDAARYRTAVYRFTDGAFYEAKALFEALGDYRESADYIRKCDFQIMRLDYQKAKELYNVGDYEAAKTLFDSFGNYHDSKERAQACADILEAQEQAARELALYQTALELKEAGDWAAARDGFIQAGDCLDATDQIYEVVGLLKRQKLYDQAESDAKDGDPEAAWRKFAALSDFKDSAEKAAMAQEAYYASLYEQASRSEADDASRAYILYLYLGEYRDSRDCAKALLEQTTQQAVYAAAEALSQEGAYAQAKAGFESIPEHGDSWARAQALTQLIDQGQRFDQAVLLRAMGEEAQANALFETLGDFQDAAAMIEPIAPRFTASQLRDDRTSEISPVFTAPDGSTHRYQIYKGVPTWVEAKAFCEVLGGHLATLTTSEENAFVHSFMLESGYLTAYFGLSDEARVGNWIWVTGEPFEYSNWHRGEPSRSGRERYGMYFYKHTKGTWNDSHFYENDKDDPGCSFICEWDD